MPISTVLCCRLNGLGPKAVKIGRFVRYKLNDVLACERQLEATAR